MKTPKHLSRNHVLYRAIRAYPLFVDSDKELLITLHKMIPEKGPKMTVAEIATLTSYTTATIRKSIGRTRKEGLLTCEQASYHSPIHVFGFTEKFKELGKK